jgi:DNA-binding transcriptional ArsR family regulator
VKNQSRSSSDAGAVDDLFAALASERRRRVLEHFEESGRETATLTELADHLSERRSDAGGRSNEQIRLRLHHVDLPKLGDAGLVTYDAETTTARVRRHDDDGRVRALLAAFGDGSN